MKKLIKNLRFFVIAIAVLAVFLASSVCAEEGLISVDYKDVELTMALKAIAYSNDLNIVMTKDISGTVSATLKNVTIDEALNAILRVNGYAYTRQGNLIYIIPGPGTEGMGQETTSIRLSYLTAEKAKQLLFKTISIQGDIQVNEATNSLVVTDYPSRLRKVRRVLSEVDIQPIQVLIEAKIVDIQSKAFENLGTKMSLTYDPNGANAGGGIFGRSTSFDESANFDTSLEGPSTTLSGGDLTIATVLKSLTASVTIDALVQEHKAHILASPSIATINGKESRIIIGERFPYLETTRDSSGTATETTKFVDVGTTLRVTPLVSPDGWITMNVHPEVSSISAALDAGPRITTREADATIRVRDKETIIIGGLINKKDDRIVGGIPGLRSIPVIGKLFSKKSTDLEETELTVFITPHIIRTKEEMEKIGKGAAEEEIFLNIEAVGNSNLVSKLWEHASNLEIEDTVESKDKTQQDRNSAILNTYKMIVNQFPESNNIDVALYKIGILYSGLRNYRKSIESFKKLIIEFPYSSYADKAEKYLKAAEQKQKERQKIIEKKLISMENK
ncbi:MAG: secretin and TonB N-terminal domain-containing protein [Candidatus Zapsychrus exili]|nr:secretin and TonB N-terminal domain-containing protein [Candidatus Zapsychrus exili]